MSKTYILEPTEFTFSSIDGYLLYEGAINSYTAENTKIDIGSETFMYALTHDNQSFDAVYVYTKDGTYDGVVMDEPTTYPDGLIIVYVSENGGIDVYSSTLYNESGATYAVSIYTSEDDPEPTPGESLSKNSIYVDHSYNNWESFLENMSGDKTGYNTIEKMSNSDVGGGGGSSDSSIFNVGVEIVDLEAGSARLNKTWQEIYDAVAAGKLVVITDTQQDLITGLDSFIIDIVLSIYAYTIETSSTQRFVAETADDYPRTDGGK